MANGTDALHLALRAYGVGPGDEVVTVANTFIATGEAILLAGARPVFVDVEPATHTMDPAKLEAAITPRTKVVLPVHLYGHPADTTAIGEIARRHGLPVLEDAAQAHGAEWRGRPRGRPRPRRLLQLLPDEEPGGLRRRGDGRPRRTRRFVARVRQIANHGAGTHRYDNVVLGTNSRLDTLQAAILRVKLRHLERWNAERAERAAAYTEALDGVPGVVTPAREGGRALGLAPLHRPRAGEGRPRASTSRSRGIGTAIHYPRPIHLQPRWPRRAGRPGDLPVSEQLSREVLCLPLYPELPLEDVERVAGEVRAFVERRPLRG